MPGPPAKNHSDMGAVRGERLVYGGGDRRAVESVPVAAGRGGPVATRVFSDEELAQLCDFGEIGRRS